VAVAGHSKWSNIKRRKGAQDVARGKLFTKLIKEIPLAARMGGPDPDANPRLRQAIDKGRSNSMPRLTIERAVKKGAGEVGGEDYETLTYEGYGPGGVAVLVQCLTDNRNRSAGEVRHAFAKSGCLLASSGSVAYQFQQKAVFVVAHAAIDEESLMMAVLEAGAEDLLQEEDEWIVTASFESYDSCRRAISQLGVELKSSEIIQVPDNSVDLSAEDTTKLIDLLERLEDLDDVQETYSNAVFSDDAL